MKYTDLELLASTHETEIIRVKDIAETRLQEIEDVKNQIAHIEAMATDAESCQ